LASGKGLSILFNLFILLWVNFMLWSAKPKTYL